MRIALVGTRGVPARYGGFETAIEEVGKRLAASGHEVVVYCRSGETKPATYAGMELVHLPAVRSKAAETLSHTALSTLHLLTHRRPDAVLVFNAANAPFLLPMRLRRLPVATHVDGLEWRRSKWGGAGRRYYRTAEALSVRWSDALIADAQGIADYYTEEFGAPTVMITYGAPILSDGRADRLAELGLTPGGYHLVVARFEPENHVHLALEGYQRSAATHPLIVVGGAPYADEYTASLHAAAEGDPRVRFLGGIWDQDQLDQLYANAGTYIHGHSVGGTNPSLLRAMGAGASVVAYDVVFNREVLGSDGRFFADAAELATALEEAEAQPEAAKERGARLRDRAAERYDWDDVASAYADLCRRLASRELKRGAASGRRAAASSWS